MLRYLLAVSAVLFLADAMSREELRNLKKMNELKDPVEDQINMVMDNVEQHCHAENQGSRKKRESDSSMRSVLRGLLEECQNDDDDMDDPNPTEPAPTAPSIHGPCTSMETVNLTGSWRKDNAGSHLRPAHNFYACDRELQLGNHWFRFTGSAGTQMSSKCRPSYSCGSHGGFWTNATMPSQVGQIFQVPIYGSWGGNCSRYIWRSTHALFVQRCSDRAGDFIYKAFGTGSCYWAFCGMDLHPN